MDGFRLAGNERLREFEGERCAIGGIHGISWGCQILTSSLHTHMDLLFPFLLYIASGRFVSFPLEAENALREQSACVS